MAMLADGIMAPSLTLEMLRVVSGSGAIFLKSDAGGLTSVGVRGLVIPTDPRPALGPLRPA
jgi:adenylate cyclase